MSERSDFEVFTAADGEPGIRMTQEKLIESHRESLESARLEIAGYKRDQDAKDARIAELEALTQPFTESELARAEGVLNIAVANAVARPVFGFDSYWLRSTVQAVAKALVADREDEG